MNKNLAQVRKDNEGAFTLVELLVVILIIGILAAIAIPAFLNQRKAAVDASVTSDVKNAATQVETWMVSNPSGEFEDFSVNGGYQGEGGLANDPQVAPLTDIKVGEGTLLTVDATGVGTYTITGRNTGGNEAVDGIVYDSTDGGLVAAEAPVAG